MSCLFSGEPPGIILNYVETTIQNPMVEAAAHAILVCAGAAKAISWPQGGESRQ